MRKGELPYFPESVLLHKGSGLRPADFTGDAGRFGRRFASGSPLRVERRVEYVGTAEVGFPTIASDHVVPGQDVNAEKRRGVFASVCAAVESGAISLSDLPEREARRVKEKLGL